ncbi:HAMP domain protein [Anoxybacillus sp. B7M1]|jgi:two-component system, OmpR family, sensor histidine kinase ArlS|uniref:Signal transduction histidine-protein kinase ArlS n=2 Tax=Anoxybacillaceae TaxID=3120669 RepID=A0ABD5IVP3_9BACL|nr:MULTISPECIES: HAMP domain-containing histidine kinase [Anoxybacillus]ANB65339.1 HAMP domain protein [Anoxybacillus sp. B7M1]ANB55510.1 HAMP domain protein [Anoxybacillus sp. B2M1]KXG10990.1 Signal transduction histidine-protein kinase ArlS [Anoxybacillus sp. P3H1B]MBS2770308.1 GHKL domain-containing protein [Anoxybacillus rupiensis]MED5051943.1 HAMP domain-containing histidine kinase [Anoxybacillus rupiensis]
MKPFRLGNVSLKWKLTFLSGSVIFVMYFLFTCLQYEVVKQWLLNEEEKTMKKTIEEIETYYEEKRNISRESIREGQPLLEKLNEKYQVIRILDDKGNVMVSVSNHASVSLLPAAQPKRLEIEYHLVNDERSIVLRKPFHFGTASGTIEIIRHLVKVQHMTNMLFIMMTCIGIIAMVMSALIGMFIAQHFVGRLQSVTKTMMDIKNKGFEQRMDVPASNDEMTQLMIMFNKMMDEIQDSFEQQKQFVEDASHELRTPIAILEGHLSLLNRWGKNNRDILEESLQAASQEVVRLKKLVLELLDLSKAEAIAVPLDLQPISPSEAAEQVVKNFRVLHPSFHFIIDNELEETVHVRMAKHHLEQLLLILMDNAVKYSQQNKKIMVCLKEEGKYVSISVVDKGIGIPRDELEKVFLRFYRVDKVRSREKGGAGLGLAIAKEIVDKYSGQISIQSEVGAGTTVELFIPKAVL